VLDEQRAPLPNSIKVSDSGTVIEGTWPVSDTQQLSWHFELQREP
jgi:hypothetical protein